jgi:hypothetical protein
MDEFVIYHIPREENPKANALAQQASGYDVQKRNFQKRKLMFSEAEGYVLEEPIQLLQPGHPVRPPLGGAISLQSSFLLKLLKTKWMVGGNL